MSISSERTGIRRPLGFVNANTLRATGITKSSGSSSSNEVVTHDKPSITKNTKKRVSNLLTPRDILNSIFTNAKKTGKAEDEECNDTSCCDLESTRTNNKETAESESCQVDETSLPSSPTKKARTSDYDAIFRSRCDEDRGNFWTAEMEDMLTLKPSRPITDESRDEESSLYVEVDELEERDDCDFGDRVRSALVKELSITDLSSAEHTVPLSHGHLKEHDEIEFGKQ